MKFKNVHLSYTTAQNEKIEINTSDFSIIENIHLKIEFILEEIRKKVN